MVSPALRHWCQLYRKHRQSAVALDIETCHVDGPIAVVSLCKKRGNNGFTLIQFTRGGDLCSNTLEKELRRVPLVLTFNGKDFDVPKINAEYAGAIPSPIPVLDLYVLAKAIGLQSGLKELEKTFRIRRNHESRKVAGNTHRLWQEWQDGSKTAPEQLLEYAAADVRNLFSLADVLIEWTEARLLLQDSREKESKVIPSLNNLDFVHVDF